MVLTPRRPRIDFSLTINRVPLSVEALRTELGSDAVFTTDTDYRGEVARRFFGGADPSAYLALLHQVRNPRVGDRIDADLPRRLAEALPPVSEEAVLDAAQPLEDLEDHRRNVLALDRTDRALGTVLDTYRQYARRVLAEAADYLAALASAVPDGVALPHDRSPIPATPWDPGLAAAFTAHRLVVHQERVMDDVLDAHAATP